MPAPPPARVCPQCGGKPRLNRDFMMHECDCGWRGYFNDKAVGE